MLVSGEAESIGDEGGKFHAEDATEMHCFPRRLPLPANGKPSFVSAGFWPTPRCRAGRHRAPHRAWRAEAAAALPHRRCGLDATRSGDRLRAAAYSAGAVGHPLSHENIFRGCRRWRVSTRPFTPDLPDVARVLPIARELRSEGIQRYGFHGLSCESIVRQLGGRSAGSPDRSPISATARASPRSKPANRSIPAWD